MTLRPTRLSLSLVTALLIGSTAHATTTDPEDWEIQELADDRNISFSEAAERLSWQVSVEDLHEQAAQELGDRFAGVWIDVDDGDRIKFGVVDQAPVDPVPTATALVQQFGLDQATDILEVEHALDTLTQTNQAIADLLVAEGPDNRLTSGLRPDLNAVEVGVPASEPLSPSQSALVDQIVAQYGSQVIVTNYDGAFVPDACSGTDCDAPLRAGVATGPVCTAGFMAESRHDGLLYMMTAGHCQGSSHRNNPGSEPTYAATDTSGASLVIGEAHNHEFGPSDAAIAHVANEKALLPQPWVYVRASAGTTRNEQYPIARDGFSVLGMRICKTGKTTGTTCGEVADLALTFTYNTVGVTVRNMGSYTACASGGDSGGPVYARHTAYGIHSGHDGARVDDCLSFYQGIRAAENLLNVDVLEQ